MDFSSISFQNAPKKAKRSEEFMRRVQTDPPRRDEADENMEEVEDSFLSGSCSNMEEEDPPFTLYFVRIERSTVDAPTDDEQKKHSEAFRVMVNSGVEPEWIDAVNVEKLTSDCKDFFVVPAFRGETFTKMCKAGLRIYGTSILLDCVNRQVPLPRWDHPVYSNVFGGTVVSVTGIPSERRILLREKVSWMNGVFSDKLYQKVTHLVALKADAQSAKYKECCEWKIPVMKPEWIEELWTKTAMMADSTVTAKHEDIVNTYKMPLLQGLVLTLSGVTGEERTTMIRLIEMHGGTVMTSMPRAKCTHLITDKTTGEKYLKATQWGTVNIVQARWLRKCIDLGYVVDERKYHPKYISTDRKTSSQRDVAPALHHDASIISGTGGCINNSSSNTTIFSPSTTLTSATMKKIANRTGTNSVVSGTTLSRSSSAYSASNPVLGVPKKSQTTPLADTSNHLIRRQSSKTLATPSATTTSTAKVFDPTDQLDVTVAEDFDFLEGCMVWLCGVDNKKLERWRKILDRTGATRVQRIEQASHVVVVSASASEKSAIRRVQDRPDIAIVTAQWIVACYEAKDFVATDDYLWSEDATLAESQLSRSHSATTIGECIENARAARGVTPLESREPSVSRGTTLEEDSQGRKGIFSGITFRLHVSLDDQLVEKLKTTIKQNGGKLGFSSAQCVVFGLYIEDLSEYKNLVVCTEYYISRCVQESTLLPIKSHPLYLPFVPNKERSSIDIFAGKVFVIDEFPNEEKKYVEALLRKFGGHVQHVIAMKQKSDFVRRSTHYICAKESDRASKCRECGIQVIDMMWVFDCVAQGLWREEHWHPFQEVPLKNFDERIDDCWAQFCEKKLELMVAESDGSTVTSVLNSESRKALEDFRLLKSDSSTSKKSLSSEIDYRKPYKMNLKLDGVSQVIDNLVSPSRECSQESVSTTFVGKILQTARVKTQIRRSTISDGTEAAKKALGREEDLRRAEEEWRVQRQVSVEKRRSAAIQEEDDTMDIDKTRPEVAVPKSVTRESDRSIRNESRLSMKRQFVEEENRSLSIAAKRLPSSESPNQLRIPIESHPAEDEPSNPSFVVANLIARNQTPDVPCSITAVDEELLTSPTLSNNDYERRFLISSINKNDVQEVRDIIEHLGGRIEEEFNPSVTHLVCQKMGRSVKQLSAIATGKWVVLVDYLRESREAGHWLNEEGFEWCESRVANKDEMLVQLAKSCREWRKLIAAKSRSRNANTLTTIGAFMHWECAIHKDDQKSCQLQPILHAGGAKVRLVSSVYDVVKPMFVLVSDRFNWSAEDVHQLEESEINVVTFDYVFEFMANPYRKSEELMKECKYEPKSA